MGTGRDILNASLIAKIKDQTSEVELLELKISKMREALKRAQYRPMLDNEDSCNAAGHDLSEESHYLVCVGCGSRKCEPCKPDCWLAEAIGENK